MNLYSAVKALLYEKHSKEGIVGSIYHLDSANKSKFIKDVMIPIVDFSSDRKDPVWETSNAADGRYFIQITLPDGDVQVESFMLKDGQAEPVIFSLPHKGPHEWTGMQAMVGQLEHFTFVDSAPAKKNVKSWGRSYLEIQEQHEDIYSLRYIRSADENQLLNENGLTNVADLIGLNLEPEESIEKLGQSQLIKNISEEDDNLVSFNFVHGGVLDGAVEKQYFDFYPGIKIERAYLLHQSSHGSTVTCLPTPWMNHGEEMEIALLLNKNSCDEKLEYSLTVGEPLINNALGYINAGAFNQATKLFNAQIAERMLFKKLSGPFTAVIGGYLMILGRNMNFYRAHRDKWLKWVGNLDNWFDWLPDGAVLNSSLYFVLGEGDKIKAHEALMRAYDRGLPYYTFGLKLMLDGMRFFANDGSREAQFKLEKLKRVADRADPSQPFLSVELARKTNDQLVVPEFAHV